MKTLLIIAAIGASGMTGAFSQLAPEAHRTDMKQLASVVRKTLPAHWRLEMTPFAEGDAGWEDWTPGIYPRIVIYRDSPVVARPKRSVSLPPRQEPKLFLLEYRLAPKVPENLWLEQQEQNKRSENLRAAYRGKLEPTRDKTLKRSGYDPANYFPTTVAERETLQEYRFVWLSTMPINLPEYHYKSLGVWATDPNDYDFPGQEAIQSEYLKVARAVEGLLVRYDARGNNKSEQGGSGNAPEPPSHPQTAPQKARATP